MFLCRICSCKYVLSLRAESTCSFITVDFYDCAIARSRKDERLRGCKLLRYLASGFIPVKFTEVLAESVQCLFTCSRPVSHHFPGQAWQLNEMLDLSNNLQHKNLWITRSQICQNFVIFPAKLFIYLLKLFWLILIKW